MKKSLMILVFATTGFFACRQDSKSTTENVQSQKPLTNGNGKYIYTKYEYIDSAGSSLIIQNSLPKSGIHYTDPTGKDYVYAVFWTRIINETENSLEFKIDFPAASRELLSTPGVYYRLFFPPDTMTIDKEPLYDYGLTDLKSFLDIGLSKPSSLKRIIHPKESSAFYVVTLSNKGLDGTLRTGFSLDDQNLVYSINKNKVDCGLINLKNLMLKNK